MEQELSSDYLDIREINPSYKDINLKISITNLELNSYLKYLTTDIKNIYGKRAVLKQVPSNTWSKILKGRPFYKNLLNSNTGRF